MTKHRLTTSQLKELCMGYSNAFMEHVLGDSPKFKTAKEVSEFTDRFIDGWVKLLGK